MELNQLSSQVIKAAIAVHRELGPGLLESVYHSCMLIELNQRAHSLQLAAGLASGPYEIGQFLTVEDSLQLAAGSFN
jgi:hypothetical protein